MKLAFDIAGDIGNTDLVLCEWGQTYCSLAALDKTAKTVHSLKYFTFDAFPHEEEVQAIIEAVKVLGDKSTTAIFCSAFPEALLIPKKFYNSNQSFLENTHSIHASSQADHIGEWQLVNNYAFPTAIDKAIKESFSSLGYYHVYTPALKIHSGFDTPAQIIIHFAPSHFRLVVKNGGQLLLVQMYSYNAPLDVVYYLLKIFQELQLSNEETAVIISGLVDEDSSLYKELHQFVHNLHFAKPGSIAIQSSHPPHFFTSLYNLASCVS